MSGKLLAVPVLGCFYFLARPALALPEGPSATSGPCEEQTLSSTSAPSVYLTSARVDPLCVRIGVDSFRLAIGVADPNIVSVILETQNRFLYQDTPISSVELFDDGSHGDALAGDGVFSLDELSPAQTTGTIGNLLIRFVPMTFRYADTHEEFSDEDLGLTLHYVSPSVPVPAFADLAADVRATRFVVNVVAPLQGEFPGHFMDSEVVSHRYYDFFPDERDFLMIAKPFNTNGFAASFRTVRNDVLGIGLETIDDSADYGSAGVLQGILSLYFGNVWPGTLNHELLHRWAAFLDPSLDLTGTGGHWGAIAAGPSGFGGNAPYAGSFDLIEHVSGNTYRARVDSEGHNNDLELYLMGLIDIDDVQSPIAALVNPVFQGYQSGYSIYIADGLRSVSTQEIVAVEGQRIPDYSKSQHFLRSAMVVVYDRLLSDVELAYYDYAMQEYQKISSTFGLTFADATGQRATISTALPCVEGMSSLPCATIPAIDGRGLAAGFVLLLGAGAYIISKQSNPRL